MKPEAMIFDLDGVLTDTARYHYEAWKNLADSLGLNFTVEDNEMLKGVSRIRSCQILFQLNHRLDEISNEQIEEYARKKNEEYVKLIRQITPDDVLDNILPLLKMAKKDGIKLAVASASKNAGQVIKSLEIGSYFDYIADAGKIRNAKPDPEVFLDCCNYLKVVPNACIGFEDAQAGIEALSAIKMFSVGIGVCVVSCKPDYELLSTKELDYDKIREQYELFKK